jgi:hypothetical protein
VISCRFAATSSFGSRKAALRDKKAWKFERSRFSAKQMIVHRWTPQSILFWVTLKVPISSRREMNGTN